MKTNSHEQSKRYAFDSFCKKILKHEARDYYDELKRQRDREISFYDLSEKEMNQLFTEDKYFSTEQIFNVLGLDVIVTDNVIAEALQSLPERRRDIILLSYFLELSDREIGENSRGAVPTAVRLKPFFIITFLHKNIFQNKKCRKACVDRL